jgi:ABC-type Mn2+/Zn2+ transport system ATPase subunit
MSYIQIKNLSVSYLQNTPPALNNINLEIPQHTTTVLIGPNGSGKSTLIKAILGMLPYQGQITINHKSPTQHYYHIGYVPQNFTLTHEFPITVYEFLNLSLTQCHHTQKEKNKMIKQTLQQIEAEPYQNKLFTDLSGGQKQRILFARALVHRPTILILDEPEAGIDPKGEKLIYQIIDKKVKNKQLTVIIASHELEIIHQHATHVICLNRKLICQGSPKQALNSKTLEKLYGSNRQIYHHHH